MSDQQNKVDSTDARKAFMEGIVSTSLASNAPAAEPAIEAPETKVAERDAEKPEGKHKKTAQERIVELAHQRRDAEDRAKDAKRENDELKSRLTALESTAKLIDVPKEPKRYDFATEEAFIEALTDYKVDKRIADRENAQREAKMATEMQEIDNSYLKTVKAAKTRYDDFDTTVSEAKDVIPPFLVMAIKESDVGGDLTYFLAKFPEETKKILAMRPVQALKYISRLEHELLEPEETVSAGISKPSQKKAPEPINPVRGTNLADMSGSAKNFEEYRSRRLAEKRNKRGY
jgi:hypothetical protein